MLFLVNALISFGIFLKRFYKHIYVDTFKRLYNVQLNIIRNVNKHF